jgi:hypothetical protein
MPLSIFARRLSCAPSLPIVFRMDLLRDEFPLEAESTTPLPPLTRIKILVPHPRTDRVLPRVQPLKPSPDAASRSEKSYLEFGMRWNWRTAPTICSPYAVVPFLRRKFPRQQLSLILEIFISTISCWLGLFVSSPIHTVISSSVSP